MPRAGTMRVYNDTLLDSLFRDDLAQEVRPERRVTHISSMNAHADQPPDAHAPTDTIILRVSAHFFLCVGTGGWWAVGLVCHSSEAALRPPPNVFHVGANQRASRRPPLLPHPTHVPPLSPITPHSVQNTRAVSRHFILHLTCFRLPPFTLSLQNPTRLCPLFPHPTQK